MISYLINKKTVMVNHQKDKIKKTKESIQLLMIQY